MLRRLTSLVRVGAIAMTVVSSTSVGAQAAEWQFSFESAAAIRLPSWLKPDSLRAALSYDVDSTEAVAGFTADLNRDGTPDYVLRASRSVCGTNCEYVLVDGRTHRTLGTVGGTVMVVRSRLLNGYPVIETYGHSSAEAGIWATMVFDGSRYIAVGSVYLEGQSQARLFDSIRGIPAWPVRR